MYSLQGAYNKALVTGGAGFVGSHIVEELLADGLEVVCLDDFSAGKLENLAGFDNNSRLTVIEADISDKGSLSNAFDGVDVVFHQAVSKNTVCLEDPQRDLAINARGTLNLLEMARDANVRKFVHASTGSVYGEAQYYPTDELHPLNPTSYYGVSKLAADRYVNVFRHLYGMNTTILRYYHVYGPRQENSDVGGVVSIFARKAALGMPLTIYGDGTQLRSFTYVKDVVDINRLVALDERSAGQIYNCASGARITIGELAADVLRLMGRTDLSINYEDWKLGDIVTFDVSNERLRALGFEWKTEFADGLSDTIGWTRDWLARTSDV